MYSVGKSFSGYNDDADFMGEVEFERTHFDKASGEVVVAGDPVERPEGDFFAEEDAGAGEQFMAVKPWIGAVVEPDNRK